MKILEYVGLDTSRVKSAYRKVTEAIIAQSQTMGLSVIAEGVETKEQRDFLARLGCQA